MANSQTTSKSSRSFVNTLRGLFTKNTAILSVCILIAFFLWLLNALSKTYEGYITVSIEFRNMPEDKVLVKDIENELQLHVKAVGFNLLWGKLNLLSADVEVDYNKYEDQAHIVAENAMGNLSNKLPGTYTILDARPDTIHFAFEERLAKKVPVLLRKDISFAQQFFYADSIRLKPDSITVSGPQSLVDTITRWPTELLQATRVEQPITREVMLKKPSAESLNLMPSKVRCQIPVEQYTEQEMKVRIHKVNVPRNLEVVILPNKVTLTFLVSLSQYENVSKDQFDVVADFSTIDIQRNEEIEVTLQSKPSFIRNIQLNPDNVKYIIHK